MFCYSRGGGPTGLNHSLHMLNVESCGLPELDDAQDNYSIASASESAGMPYTELTCFQEFGHSPHKIIYNFLQKMDNLNGFTIPSILRPIRIPGRHTHSFLGATPCESRQCTVWLGIERTSVLWMSKFSFLSPMTLPPSFHIPTD